MSDDPSKKYNMNAGSYTENPEFLAVRRLYRKFGFIESSVPTHLTSRKALERAGMMAEEVVEFIRAAARGDMAGMADALVDLDVFLKGTASMMGLPWKALFDDVDRANMGKERGVGKRGFTDDIIKPPGWVGPKTEEILASAGYDPERPPIDDPKELPLQGLRIGDRVRLVRTPPEGFTVGGVRLRGPKPGTEGTVIAYDDPIEALYAITFSGGPTVFLSPDCLEKII